MSFRNVLIVYAHPEPQSMNGTLFTTAVATFEALGHRVKTSNLNELGFNPVSGRHNFTSLRETTFFKQQAEEMYASEVGGFAADIERELQKVEWCDLMIWQFPLWWFSVPGILKGWVDRVFVMGRAYGNGKIYETGVFRGKKALLSLTTGGTAESYQPDGTNGDLSGILRPLHRGVLEFTGFSVLSPHVVYGPARQSEQEINALVANYETRLRMIWEEPPLVVGRY
ncbi:NAD(P)H-dependent oxidoreductase [Spirosoma arcticum]